MANSDKDILITPNTGSSSADPKIEYVGADSSGNDTITVETLYDGTKATLSFEGSAGQLFSIVNDLTSDPIFSVNDVSGIPSIEVDSDGEIRLAEFSGNVGIGTSSPSGKLEVADSDGGATVFINNTQSWTASALSEFNNTALAISPRASGAQLRFSGATGDVRIQSLTSDLSTAEDISLNPVGGNVGIGTSSPQSKLETNLHSGADSSLMNANTVNDVHLIRAGYGQNAATTANAGAKWGLRFVGRNDGTYNTGKSGAIFAVSEDSSAGYNRSVGLAFHTSAFDVAHTERMRIDSVGRVGIGTTAMSSMNSYGSGLTVGNSGISGSAGMTIYASANTGYSSVYFGDPDDTKVGWLEYAHGSDALTIAAGNAERMRINSSGSLLVGTTTTDRTADDGITANGLGFVDVSRSSNISGRFTRRATDGAIVDFRKDSTTVGRIGTATGTTYIDGGSTFAGLQFGGDGGSEGRVVPRRNGSLDNGGTTLGTASYRFKDLYLSGEAYASTYRSDGDSDTYLSFPAANQLSLVGGGATLFKAYQIAGAYGVLEAHGSGSATYPNYTFNGDTNTGMYRATTDTLAFTTGGSEGMRIQADGTTTIGRQITTTYNNTIGYALHIQGAGGTQTYLAISVPGANSGDTGVVIGHDGGGTRIINREADPIIFHTNSGSETMRLTSDGKLGIGTPSPGTNLHVGTTGGNSYSTTITKGSNMKGGVFTQASNGNDMVGVYFATGSTTEGTHWSGITGSRSDSASHWGTQLNFYTHNNDQANLNDATQKMVLDGSGNLYIGSGSQGAAINQARISAIHNTIPAARFAQASSSNGLPCMRVRHESTTAGNYIEFRTDENVLTGQIQDVSGTMQYQSASDSRLKENVESMNEGLTEILAMNPVKFTWKNIVTENKTVDMEGAESRGFLAQELNEQYPWAVSEGGEDEKEKPWSVDYGKLTPILVKAIQEQQTLIESLEARIAALES